MIAEVATRPMWMPTGEELTMLGPLWTLIGTLVAILVGATLIYGRNWRVTAGVAVIGSLLTALLAYRGYTRLPPGSHWSGMTPPGASGPMLLADQFSYFFILMLALFMALIGGLWYLGHLAAPDRQPGHKQDAVEFFILFIGSAFGMALMVSTTNLLMLLLAVEMASLPSYAIVGFRKHKRLSAEASVKYVLFGAVTSAIMVYGVSLVYGQFRTLDFAEIGRAIATQSQAAGGPTLLMGVSLFAVMIGIAFKISAVPFHFWCPDVFEGASIEVTTWLSVASKAAGLGLMLRLMTALAAGFGNSAEMERTLMWISMAIGVMAALTCTVGNLSAFRQMNMKRLLAFSSIAHAGYMLMLVAILWRPGSGYELSAHPAFSALAAYLIVYLFMNLGAFGVVAIVYWSTGSESIEGFKGLGRRNPALAAFMAICLFSLVGLPPFGGFIAKWYLLSALYDGGLVWLIVVAVFNTLISLYYYARVIYAMYFADDAALAPVHTPATGSLLVAASAVIIVFTGTFGAGLLKKYSDQRATGVYAVVRPASAASPEPNMSAELISPPVPHE